MQCSVFIATSLDGKIARRDGSVDWLARVDRPGEDYGYKAFFDSIDTIVVGRTTYEAALAFPSWPYEGKNVVVFTHRSLDARHGERAWSGSPIDLVRDLQSRGAKHAYVDGGQIIRAFLSARAIHEMTISIIPIVLGEGIPLFDTEEVALDLVRARAFESGLVQIIYRPR